MTSLHARFDDLQTGTVLGFAGARSLLEAHRPDEVPLVLDAVDRATRSGKWAAGFLAYEAAAGLDPAFAVHPGVPGLPLAWFSLHDGPVELPALRPGGDGRALDWVPAWSAPRFEAEVEAVRSRIAAGEVYQVNLTTRMTARFDGPVTGFYRDLALAQRGAYNAFLDAGRFSVASASPELFFELRGDEVLLRPMKGTAPRGRTPAEDQALAAALVASPKERAENVMIVDLVRNDIARVAASGSVRVPSLLRVERYPTVLQLTSDVTARLVPHTSLTDLFRAVFPCGSITGAPKISAMRLIRELEPWPRGVYCGAIGYVAPPTAPVRARFSVAIRTAVVDTETGHAEYGTGAGITWGSDPAAEFAEVMGKTAVLGSIVRPSPSRGGGSPGPTRRVAAGSSGATS
ncbi:aminodeoxychorismate synthase component I [Labedaea rhizosphaerae]|uniref:Para-aminobenzoate synthetase/4-amino-4-deoxychorismate lyase n=1 Tax=Labedaea rhizosphaerae TaxID=598644 RepID=A0A4R6SC57_LABRH|nr:aminodeoxychorismate synthase component I [Labedaea rhizosphaerae]TDP96505.1 para-aminobenzoate synthetase/4-amino-4-deoxychorismate lyase [Labedaea rhizosphaerae]